MPTQNLSANPTEWPCVSHLQYLVYARCHQSAYVQYDYPFGNTLRCIRRLWAEQGDRAGTNTQWRLVYQTTRKNWNVIYTERMEKLGSEEAQKWAVEQYDEILSSVNWGSYWNKPHTGIYHPFQCWEEVECWPSTDAQWEATRQQRRGFIAVRPLSLTINTNPTQLKSFLAVLADLEHGGAKSLVPVLSREQLHSLHLVETGGKRYNKDTWEENPIDWGMYKL